MSDYESLLQSLTPEMYTAFRQALQLGKWPNGAALTDEQKGLCMEAVIKYEHNNSVPEPDRVGYIDRRKADEKAAANKEQLNTGEKEVPDQIKWVKTDKPS